MSKILLKDATIKSTGVNKAGRLSGCDIIKLILYIKPEELRLSCHCFQAQAALNRVCCMLEPVFPKSVCRDTFMLMSSPSLIFFKLLKFSNMHSVLASYNRHPDSTAISIFPLSIPLSSFHSLLCMMPGTLTLLHHCKS